MKKRTGLKGAIIFLAGVFWVASVGILIAQDPGPTPIEELGDLIFNDENLSINRNQSCATCHNEDWGTTGPDSGINAAGAVYEGSIPGRFGNRKPPSSAYATPSPIFFQDKKGLFVGGNFWDGRATGEKLGNPAADQAQGPFLNPVEQALPDSACVVHRVCEGDYRLLFKAVWGAESCAIAWPDDMAVCESERGTVALSEDDRRKSDMAYDNIALSIAAYEDSPEVNQFTSKYDVAFTGKVKLSKLENKGFALFRGKGKCHRCHISNGQEALFTDFTFDNLGVPRNLQNPFYTQTQFNPLGFNWVDEGLGGFLRSLGYPEAVYEQELGKMKVPTLRNVDLRPDESSVKAYGHNGYFKSLKGIVHFYNTRDVKPTCPNRFTSEADAIAMGCWPEPEVAENVNTDELGDLGLTPDEEDAIVAFLKTLSDAIDP